MKLLLKKYAWMARNKSICFFNDDHIKPKSKLSKKNKNKMEIDGKSNHQILQWAANNIKKDQLNIDFSKLKIGLSVQQFLFIEGKNDVWGKGENWKVYTCGYDWEMVESTGQMICAPDEKSNETEAFINAIKEYQNTTTGFFKGSGKNMEVKQKRCELVVELYKNNPDAFNNWRTIRLIFKHSRMIAYLTTQSLIDYSKSFTLSVLLSIINEYGYVDHPSASSSSSSASKDI